MPLSCLLAMSYTAAFETKKSGRHSLCWMINCTVLYNQLSLYNILSNSNPTCSTCLCTTPQATVGPWTIPKGAHTPYSTPSLPGYLLAHKTPIHVAARVSTTETCSQLRKCTCLHNVLPCGDWRILFPQPLYQAAAVGLRKKSKAVPRLSSFLCIWHPHAMKVAFQHVV